MDLPPGALDQLASRLPGRLHLPASPEFEEACTIWNAMIERRPGLVIRCSTAADVSHAVRFAREHDLVLAVRGGGHNIAGNALCDGGVMLDLSPMRAVEVNPSSNLLIGNMGAVLFVPAGLTIALNPL